MTISRRTIIGYGAGATAALAAPAISRAQAAPIRLILAHNVPTSHLGHRTAETFATRVKEGTGGQVTIDIKPASQLFNLRTAAEALQLGTLDLCWGDLGTLANWQPYLGFMSLPFLFDNFDHVKRVMYGPVGEQVAKQVKESLSTEILSFGASGFRVFLSKKPIHVADDVRGIKLRVPEIPTWVEMAKAMGASATPIPAGEVYTALQTGVIDAIEFPPDTIAAARIYEVAGFASRTNHILTEYSLMASAKKMASLPLNVQKVMREEAVHTVQNEMFAANILEQQAAWDVLASKIKADSAPDIPTFRAKMAPVLANFSKKTGAKGQAMIDAVQATAKA